MGSGEYLAVMAGVEGALIEGRPPRYVQIPTAAAAEGADRLQYWLDLGAAQAEPSLSDSCETRDLTILLR